MPYSWICPYCGHWIEEGLCACDLRSGDVIDKNSITAKIILKHQQSYPVGPPKSPNLHSERTIGGGDR